MHLLAEGDECTTDSQALEPKVRRREAPAGLSKASGRRQRTIARPPNYRSCKTHGAPQAPPSPVLFPVVGAPYFLLGRADPRTAMMAMRACGGRQ